MQSLKEIIPDYQARVLVNEDYRVEYFDAGHVMRTEGRALRDCLPNTSLIIINHVDESFDYESLFAPITKGIKTYSGHVIRPRFILLSSVVPLFQGQSFTKRYKVDQVDMTPVDPNDVPGLESGVP